MRKPRQQRSAETLERVIQSAERLLRQHYADDVTIAQVVEDSGVSVGSIYARFADKDGVFAELVSRFMRTTLSKFDELDIAAWEKLSLEQAVAEMVSQCASIYREHRGVLRAVNLRMRAVRSPVLRSALEDYNHQVANDMRRLLQMHVNSIQHPDPDAAINMCIEVTATTLRDAIVFGAESQDVDAIKTRVTDLLYRFLRCNTQ